MIDTSSTPLPVTTDSILFGFEMLYPKAEAIYLGIDVVVALYPVLLRYLGNFYHQYLSL